MGKPFLTILEGAFVYSNDASREVWWPTGKKKSENEHKNKNENENKYENKNENENKKRKRK